MRGDFITTPLPLGLLGLLDELVDSVGRLGLVEFSFKYAAFIQAALAPSVLRSWCSLARTSGLGGSPGSSHSLTRLVFRKP